MNADFRLPREVKTAAHRRQGPEEAVSGQANVVALYLGCGLIGAQLRVGCLAAFSAGHDFLLQGVNGFA